MGMLCYTDKPVEEDAVIVRLLKESGAIILVRGNLP